MPTPPKLEQPGEKSRKLLMQKDKSKQRNLPKPLLKSTTTDTKTSDIITIMSATGGVLTLWALAENNWVWGYLPLDAFEFGNAAKWRILPYKNGQVQIKNEKQSTCLTGYKNGVIHSKCDLKNQAQFWIIKFFDNQAIQLKNVGKNTCLQTPTIRTTNYYSIYLTQCVTSKEENLDQQWYIMPNNTTTYPIFILKQQ